MLADNINALQESGGSKTFKLGKYTFDISLEVTESPVNPSTGEAEKKLSEAEELQLKSQEPELMHRESIRREKAEEETLRNTIALLHTLFSILKSIVGPIKVLITLISNYKINKAYAQEKHQDNLITCFMDAMSRLGLMNKSKTDGSSARNSRLYPVRTLKLYNYVNGTLKVKMDGPATSEILSSD